MGKVAGNPKWRQSLAAALAAGSVTVEAALAASGAGETVTRRKLQAWQRDGHIVKWMSRNSVGVPHAVYQAAPEVDLVAIAEAEWRAMPSVAAQVAIEDAERKAGLVVDSEWPRIRSAFLDTIRSDDRDWIEAQLRAARSTSEALTVRWP
jgi:hypothetical protein